jgi:hypothetical protein
MSVFNQSQGDMLAKIADWYLPAFSLDSETKVYDFTAYVEAFLSAFDQDPPRIFAGGPFSNRTAPPGGPSNDFLQSLPLSRYQRLAWKLRIDGPQALAIEPFVVLNSDAKNYTGLNEVLVGGVNSAIRLVNDLGAKRIPVGSELLTAAGPDFRQVFPGLVAEAAFSAPEYNGNLTAWKEIYYPGDSQPAGYPGEDVSAPPGPDPFDLTALADLMLWLSTIFEHGKVFK